MGGQQDVDAVVDVEPLGMVIELFRRQGDAGHPAKRRVEIGEAEGLDDGVAPVRRAPAPESCSSAAAAPDSDRAGHQKLSPVAVAKAARACASLTTLMAVMPSAAAGLQLIPRSSR